jgi:hypothetical protein
MSRQSRVSDSGKPELYCEDGTPAAIVNAVVEAFWHFGVRHIDIPITPPKV